MQFEIVPDAGLTEATLSRSITRAMVALVAGLGLLVGCGPGTRSEGAFLHVETAAVHVVIREPLVVHPGDQVLRFQAGTRIRGEHLSLWQPMCAISLASAERHHGAASGGPAEGALQADSVADTAVPGTASARTIGAQRLAVIGARSERHAVTGKILRWVSELDLASSEHPRITALTCEVWSHHMSEDHRPSYVSKGDVERITGGVVTIDGSVARGEALLP